MRIPSRFVTVSSRLAMLCLTFLPALLTAAPTAVNDSYSVNEDAVLTVGGGTVLIDANFDSAAPPSLDASWDYLDTAATTANGGNSSYPVDGASRDWKAGNFDKTTSTASKGAWKTGNGPFAGGGVTGIPTPGTTLVGIGGGAGGNNLLNTYLFRNTLTLTAGQAATTSWRLRLLADDGAIVYINGTKVAEPRMTSAEWNPAGVLNMDTLTGSASDEVTYFDQVLDLTGIITAGVNTIAVELHQTTVTSADIGMDLTLEPSGVTGASGGFAYVDDPFTSPFNTNKPTYVDGVAESAGGFSGGALHVVATGSTTFNFQGPVAGGWEKAFALTSAAVVTINLRYRLTTSADYDTNDWIDCMLDIDGTKYGDAPGSLSVGNRTRPVGTKYLHTFIGDGSGGAANDSGWLQRTITTGLLAAGNHTMVLGLFERGTNKITETADAWFDDVLVSTVGGSAGVLANDTGTSMTAVKDTNPANGSVVFNADGSFSYTPAANFNGTDSFTYHAVDATGSSNVATVNLTVTPQNDAPVGAGETYAATEDVPLVVNAASGVLANDTDIDGNTLTATKTLDPNSGTVTLAANGSFTYTPVANFNGQDSFRYTISDGTVTVGPFIVTINVAAVNDAPVGVADAYATTQGTPLVVTLTAPSGGVTETVLASKSVWKYKDDGSDLGTVWKAATYALESGWAEGPAELGYGDGGEATVVDDSSLATYVSSITNPPGRYITTYFRSHFSVADKARLSNFKLQVQRDDGVVIYLNGTEILRDKLSSSGATVLATDLADNAADDGAALIDFSASLSQSAVAAALVDGDNVFAVEIHQNTLTSSDISFDLEFSADRSPYVGVLANDSDPEGAALTAGNVVQPAHGTVVMAANGTFTYTPAAGYFGTDTFTYKASDGGVLSAATTVTIAIQSASGNTRPVPANDAYATDEDTTLNVPAPGVVGNDIDADGDAVTAQLATGPAQGTLNLLADGSFTYTPPANFNGPVTFTYRPKDPTGPSVAAATVTITVNPVNDAPVGVADTYATEPGVALTVAAAQGVLANDTDPEANALTAVLVAGPTAGTGSVSLNSNGSFTYTPPAVYSGTATFTYRANDGSLNSAVTTVSIGVSAKPLAGNDSYSATEDTPLSVTAANGVLKNDSDPDGSPITARLISQALHGSVVLNTNGSFDYTPALNYNGADSFTYVANDGTRDSLVATVSLTVAAVNDLPVAVNDTYSTVQDLPLTVPAGTGVLANDTDPDSTGLTAALAVNPSHGSLSFSADGSFTYTPAVGFTGVDTFSYTAADLVGASNVATVTVTVGNDAANIVINEFVFSPAPEALPAPNAAILRANAKQEWIELHNISTHTVDLSGWAFDKGVNFTIPAGTTIPAGGFLVVAADPVTFSAKFPSVTAYIASAGWIPNPLPPLPYSPPSLSNRAETIRLVTNLQIVSDQVDYSDDGDWAERRLVNVYDHSNTPGAIPSTRPGLEWVTLAEIATNYNSAGTASVQLRQPTLGNRHGQNWKPAAPTPGSANAAVLLTDAAPLISGVKHRPQVPAPNQQINVTAQLEDELATGVEGTLYYRTGPASSTTANAAAFSTLTMLDDGLHGDGAAGDGEYGATIPGIATAGTVVEFYVGARDTALNARTWPAPTTDASGANPLQNANCLFQVIDPAASPYTGNQPLYLMVMTGKGNYDFDQSRWPSASDVGLNMTLIIKQGQDYTVRYRASLRVRGNSSRSWNPRPLRADWPKQDDWNGRSSMNLNCKLIWNQIIGSKMLQCAGVPREDGVMVNIRLNGTNHAEDGSNSLGGGLPSFGSYFDLIPWGAESVDGQFPTDTGGSCYHKIRAGSWSTASHPTAWPPAGGLINQGWTKENNKLENNWDDLGNWLNVMNATASGANYYATISQVADVDQWAKWFAVCAIVNHAETNLSNGDDDDYHMYFGEIDKRAKIVGHDYDTLFNIYDSGTGAGPTATIWQATDPSFVTSPTIPLMDRFYRDPVCCRKYKAALRNQLTTVFSKPNFDAMCDQVMAGWASTTTNLVSGSPVRQTMKSFMDARRTHILGLLPTFAELATQSLPFITPSTLATSNGFPRSTSATDLGGLGGSIDGAATAKVTVNGVTVAQDNYNNTWTAAGVITLAPGINTLLCQAWDENNVQLASGTVTIWYDDASTAAKGPSIATETWTAAGGPYTVASSLTVTGTLTIEPGTTVYLATGANFSVGTGGRLLAQGTAAQPIRFTSAPAPTATTWGGMVIGSSTLTTKLSHVIIQNNASTAIHTTAGADVEIDRVTFGNAGVQFLSLDGSSFSVTNCSFPAPSGNFEGVHGTGGIKTGGRGIFGDCTFGAANGYNDVIDFTGGNRPGSILHVYNCVFNGSGDDILDLDGTDAWIEGNVFLHCHKSAAAPDSSSAVSGGVDGPNTSQVTLVRNIIYDCDQAINMKGGNSGVLLNNTIVHITKTGGTDTASAVVNYSDLTAEGAGVGFYLEGNVIWDVEGLARNRIPSTLPLVYQNNVLPVAWTGDGTGNTVVTDPQLNLNLIADPQTVDAATVRAALTPKPCSAAIAAGSFSRDRGAYIAQGIGVQRPPASVWGGTSIVLPVGPGGAATPGISPAWAYGYTAYRYSLDGGAVSAETPVATPISLTGLTTGAHTLSVTGKLDSGIWDTATTVVNWTTQPSAPTVVINEILADNLTAYAVGATRPDVIELYNYGTTAASLAGGSISDDPLLPLKYVFPAGTSIPAGGYLVLLADSVAGHLGFSLDAGGETVTLYAPGSVVVDSVSFGPQIRDLTIGRIGQRATWALATPTVGAANAAQCDLGLGTGLKINEWIGSNAVIVSGDFIELYNPEAKPVAISGYMLTDDFTNWAALKAAFSPSVHTMAPLSFIPAGGFVKLAADGSSSSGNHTSFKVSKIQESLALLDPAGNRLDHVLVLPGVEDVSQGRLPDGAATIVSFTGGLSLPTPGFSNSTDLSSQVDVFDNLRITEIMYNPPAGQAEWIELHNRRTSPADPMDVSGVNFANGITWTFPAASSIPAGGYIVLVASSDLSKFTAQYPGVTVAGTYSGKLDNNGERVRLEIGTYSLGVLDFSYNNTWYSVTDGRGSSLQIVDETQPRTTWGDKVSWYANPVPSPGSAPVFGVSAGIDQSVTIIGGGLPGTSVLEGGVSYGPFSAGQVTLQWTQVSGPAGGSFFVAPNAAFSNAQFTLPGLYTLRLTATGPSSTVKTDDVLVTVNDSFLSYADRVLAGAPAANRTPDADADGDGFTNLVEFALGGNPLNASSTGEPLVSVEGNRLTATVTQTKFMDPAISLVPQISDFLNLWSPGLLIFPVSETTTTRTWKAQDPDSLGTFQHRFIRVKVIQP